MREIWKSEDNKISNPIGLYDLREEYDRYAFFSRNDEGDLTTFVTEKDLIDLFDKLKLEKLEKND